METLNNVGGAVAEARDNIHKGPVPEWVVDCPFDLAYQAKQYSQHVTCLLQDHQVQAELHETYHHEAHRLESLESVQNSSQWRLEFEPQTQSCVLHTLHLRREGVVIDQLFLERGRCLQREAGLDRLSIDGWLTFLIILEDVRVGDVLEWSYTVKENPRILPQYCCGFFTLPSSTHIGKYHFVVGFNSGRDMKRKAAGDWKLEELAENGFTRWQWTGENYAGVKLEPHTPASFIAAPRIGFSDCPDWGVVAAAVAQVWSRQISQSDADTTVFDEWVKAAEAAGADLATRITKAIELVQDDCRYLSVDLEFGGQIPKPPALVARRRYGDCKDVSFLLASLLQRLGVSARPILVHTVLRQTVGEWLPNPGLFNHVIVEFEAEGKRRWVDPTYKRQGGGAFNRFVENYGLGLPIEAGATGLSAFPEMTAETASSEFRETILVDTTGANSLVSLVSLAKGAQADYRRNQLAGQGREERARRSLQRNANRFGWAKRVGEWQHHDDRVNNCFTTAEVFEVKGFLSVTADRKRYAFQLPSHWLKQAFVMPENKERRTPFALPHPCHWTHIIEVESAALRQMDGSKIAFRFASENPFFRFNRQKKTGYKFWTMTYSVETRSDAVPADKIMEYREQVQTLWNESTWALFLPAGYARLKGGRDFGQLPSGMAKVVSALEPPKPTEPSAAPEAKPVEEPVTAEPVIATQAATPVIATQAATPVIATPAATQVAAPGPVQPATVPPASDRRRRRSHKHSRNLDGSAKEIPAVVKIAGIAVLAVVLIVLVVLVMAKKR